MSSTKKAKRPDWKLISMEKAEISGEISLNETKQLHILSISDFPDDPVTLSSSDLSCFVADETLYARLQLFDPQRPDLQRHLPAKTRAGNSKFVFLTTSMMQLMNVGKCDFVALRNPGNGGREAVYRAWPWPEDGADRVFALFEAISENPDEKVEVFPVRNFRVAGNVEVSTGSKNPAISGFEVPLSLEMNGNLVKKGQIFQFNFYGKIFEVEISRLEGIFEENFISEKFEELKIVTSTPLKKEKTHENPDQNYFLITESTKIQFTKRESEENFKDNLSLDPIFGLDKEIEVIRQFVSSNLTYKGCTGILLYGPSGTGKTTLGKQLHKCLGFKNSAYLNGAEIFSKFSGETEMNLRKFFKGVNDNGVIFVDEIDVLCPANSATDQGFRVKATLRGLLDDLQAKRDGQMVFVCATNQPNKLDPGLRRPGRLDLEVEVPVPDSEARYEILSGLLLEINHSLSDEDIRSISQVTHGFIGSDLKGLVLTSDPKSIAGFEAGLRVIRPSAMREIQVQVPDVKWSDIGGMEDLKLKLRQAVEWPIKHPDTFRRMGVEPPRGVLMYGPPGCSKTMIAKALARESGLNFVAIKGPELFSKWVGESEQAIRDIFSRARRVSPSVVFFDEIDAIGGSRGGDSKVSDRVLAQMLTEMDGIEKLSDVVILAATNRPDMIDPALMRPGRLDRVVYVPLPDYMTRLKILEVHTSKKPLHEDISLEDIAKRTDGYSGAELAGICNEAALVSLEESLSNVQIHRKHFESALEKVTPRIDAKLLQVYENFKT